MPDELKSVPLSIEDYENHLKSCFEQAQGVKGWNTNYVHKSAVPFKNEAWQVKPLAFYLPQFHMIPENSQWWGEGFTEWTNVTKAVPQFLGHYQPHLPGELGFYDLSNVESLKKQAQLARYYGIEGFCFHHYWFNGKRLLHKPLELLYQNKDIDIRFAVSWANENWSRRWDGLDSEVLMDQNHNASDDIEFFDSLIPYFNDGRYIRVNNCPLLIVYRLSLFPNPKETCARWRKRAKEHGLPGVYLVGVKSFDIDNPTEHGFDAGLEFPPHQVESHEITSLHRILNPDYCGKIYDYERVAKSFGKKEYCFPCFKGVMPHWDNDSRKPGKGYSYVNSTPENYAHWLRDACQSTIKQRGIEYIFINAWNEWAEGAHLEPDRKNGYAYLQATAATFSLFANNFELRLKLEELNKKFKKRTESCINLHLYYPDLLDEIFNRLKQSDLDIVVTLPNNVAEDLVNRMVQYNLNVYYILVPNIGRDIKPFLEAFKLSSKLGYRYICKLHSKKSLHRLDGDTWRSELFDSLIGSKAKMESIKRKFQENPNLGIIAPVNSVIDLSIKELHLGNIKWLNVLVSQLGRGELVGNYSFEFVAGSMFWFSTNAFSKLDLLLKFEDDFELEAGQLDGTLAHSFERIFSLVAQCGGYETKEVSKLEE